MKGKKVIMYIKQSLENEGLIDKIPFMLMSLRETPHMNILSGKKKYEFRSRFTEGESLAFIYVSNTVREIQSIIYFGEAIRGNAEALSVYDYEHNSNSFEGLDNYFHHGEGCAIPVKAIWTLNPIKLSTLKKHFDGFVVPQSYYWLSNKPELLNMLLEMEVKL